MDFFLLKSRGQQKRNQFQAEYMKVFFFQKIRQIEERPALLS